MRKKYMASLALSISAAGFLGTFPLVGTGFIGGMVHDGFLAATIGGLADWFAVTALFRKPLGISYRTDILRRNRQRIMSALIDYSADDLLSVDNIMDAVRHEDMAKMMVDYLRQRGGLQRLETTLDAVLREVVDTFDIPAAVQRMEPLWRQELQQLPWEKKLLAFLPTLAEGRYSDRFLQVLLELAGRLLHAPEMQDILLAQITIMRRQYEEGSSGRAMVFQMLDLTDEKLRDLAVEHVDAYLQQLQTGKGENYGSLRTAFVQQLQAWSGSEAAAAWLAACKEQQIAALDVVTPVADWLEQKRQADPSPWLAAVHEMLEAKVKEFAVSSPLQKRYDDLVKGWLERELIAHHGALRHLIEQRLDEFSDDGLVEFVETRIEDDIQMIRINGSVVGSFVGMVLYTIVFLMEKGMD
jgi:uncharacterized membrane-anchored protein YjiN (DUF445 family)